MKSVSYTMVYDGATIEQVHEMLADQAFRERVCAEQGVVSHDVSITPAGEGMSVRIEQVQDTQGVPGFAKKIVGDTTTVIQEEAWSSPVSADITVTIPGKPGDIRGTVAINSDDAGVKERVDLHIKVAIPLVGGKIEGLLAEILTEALEAEQRVGTKWLA